MLDLVDLQKTFNPGTPNEVRALRGVTLRLERGSFLIIIGTNGSGKSTLLNQLGGLDSPTRGTLHYRGWDLGAADEAGLTQFRRNAVGFVFQAYNLFPHMSVIENVMLSPVRVHGVPRDQAREEALALLTRFGLRDKAEQYPDRLSGGQQQRVAIARALVTTPSLLLADEPTGNLDTESSREIMTILDRLNRDAGITVILVTHEPDIAAYAAREIVIKDGQVLTDRRTRPEHPSFLVGR